MNLPSSKNLIRLLNEACQTADDIDSIDSSHDDCLQGTTTIDSSLITAAIRVTNSYSAISYTSSVSSF